MIGVGACSVWTLCAVALLFGRNEALPIAGCAAGLAILQAALTRDLRHVRRVLVWSAPLSVPLVIIHAVLNPAYPVSAYLPAGVPLRLDGLWFSLSVVADLSLLFVLAGAWLALDRDRVVAWLASRRLPTWLVMIGAQSVAVAMLAQRRAHAVHLAQRARGVPVGPGLWARLRALPSLVLPVIVALVVDAERRAAALSARGFGSVPMRLPWVPPIARSELRAVTLGAAVAAAAFLFL